MSIELQTAEDAMRLSLLSGRQLRLALEDIIEVLKIASYAVLYDRERNDLIGAYLRKQKAPEVHG